MIAREEGIQPNKNQTLRRTEQKTRQDELGGSFFVGIFRQFYRSSHANCSPMYQADARATSLPSIDTGTSMVAPVGLE